MSRKDVLLKRTNIKKVIQCKIQCDENKTETIMCCSIKADIGFSSTFRDRTDCRLSEININVVKITIFIVIKEIIIIKRVSTDKKETFAICM